MNPTRREFLTLIGSLSLGAEGGSRIEAGPGASMGGRATVYVLDDFFVAGFQYHEGPAVVGRMASGHALRLVREPDNPHDRRAIRLEWEGRHVGYMPRRRNSIPSRLLDQGAPLTARILAVDADPDVAPWEALRAVVEIHLPPA